MAAARGQATRGWLELRDAVLAGWRVALVLAQLMILTASALAEEQATKKLAAPGKSEGAAARLRLRAPPPVALPPKLDEAIEPPAFGATPSTEETSETASAENGVDPMARPDLDPPAIPAPALSLEVRERPALVLPRPRESVISEEALLSPAAAAPTVSEAPSPATPIESADRSSTAPDVTPSADEPPAEVDVLSLVRAEIKQRLPYFEGCARSARRRTGVEVRRLQATWSIAPDGVIKSMKVDGIDDPELGACIVRVGFRPFTVHPGVDLVIPTPIVFVR